MRLFFSCSFSVPYQPYPAFRPGSRCRPDEVLLARAASVALLVAGGRPRAWSPWLVASRFGWLLLASSSVTRPPHDPAFRPGSALQTRHLPTGTRHSSSVPDWSLLTENVPPSISARSCMLRRPPL